MLGRLVDFNVGASYDARAASSVRRHVNTSCRRLRRTAGIGENSVGIRARFAERLQWLGVSLDPAENARHARRISRTDSQIPVYIVPTDEELMIAQHTLSLLWNRHASSNPKRERAS